MRDAAKRFEFEKAAQLRDRIKVLKSLGIHEESQVGGLIGTGNLTDSPLTRFWSLPERLGPVKSSSYRLASRIANMLRAGHPVKDYADFESCILILVCVPEEKCLASGIRDAFVRNFLAR